MTMQLTLDAARHSTEHADDPDHRADCPVCPRVPPVNVPELRGGREYQAKWAGSCASCHKAISVGDPITWFRSGVLTSGSVTFHATCPKRETPRPADAPPELRSLTARWDGRCDGCGGRVREGDRILYAKGVGQFHDRQECRDGERPGQTDLDLSVLPFGTTRYAVPTGKGDEHQFLRVDRLPLLDARNRRPVPEELAATMREHPTEVDRLIREGYVYPHSLRIFVKQQLGDGERRVGVQDRGTTYRGVLADALRAILADPERHARLYGTKLGRCSVCDAELTNAESRALGIGPVCRKRFDGWAPTPDDVLEVD